MSKTASSKSQLSHPPISKLLGFHGVHFGKGKASISMRTSPKQVNMVGTTHGGIIVDLADAAMGLATMSLLPPNRKAVTVELKINFFRPVLPNTLIQAKAKVLWIGRSLSFIECEVRDSSKKLVAKASSTCKAVSAI